jgi:hypothetical protein
MAESDEDNVGDDMIARARHDLNSVTDVLRALRENGLEGLRPLAGPNLDEMLNAYESTEDNIKNPNEQLRLAALLLIKDYWKPRKGFWRECRRLAFDDPNHQVRGVALLTLLLCHAELPPSMIELVARITQADVGRLSASVSGEQEKASARRKQIVEDGRNRRLRIWRKLVGSSFDDLVAHPELLSKYFSHPDPKVRLVALSFSEDDRSLGSEFFRSCEKLAMHDPDREVQESAINVLARLHARTADRRIGGLLVEVMKDDSRPTSVRRAAYSALFQLRGLPASTWPIMARHAHAFRFPDDVDWSFVASFLP